VSATPLYAGAGYAEIAKRIDVLFWVKTAEVSKSMVLDGVPIPHGAWERVRCGIYEIASATCVRTLKYPTSLLILDAYCRICRTHLHVDLQNG